MKAAIFDAKPFEIEALNEANGGRHHLVYFPELLNENSVQLAEGFEAVSVFCNDSVNAQVMQQLKKLNVKGITTRTAGYNHIDTKKAAELGIHVARVPEYSPYSVAEHAVALLMALNRKIVTAANRIQLNNFLLDNLVGFDMHGKTVGVIGTGKIGNAFIKIMQGFGCKLLAFDPEPAKKLADVDYCKMEKIWAEADIISLHCPLNEQTKYIIRKETLQLTKPGVYIINTGRGALLHTGDAIEFIKNGHIGALGLDVYENEAPLFFRDRSSEIIQDDVFARLKDLPNVLITGHQAFLTATALQNIADTTIENFNAFETGSPGPNAIN